MHKCPGPLDTAAPGIRSFYGWICEEEALQNRPLHRADLSLEKVYRWAANFKIIEHEANPSGFQVRLFGTAFVSIYGRDLTGQFLDKILPDPAKETFMAAYVQALSGTVTYERVAFAWPDKKAVAYERLIYPLVEGKEIRKFAVVGFRIVGDRGFLVEPSETVRVSTQISQIRALA